MVNNQGFRVEERGSADNDGNKAKVLIDDKGVICGIFSSEAEASTAAPKIAHNLEKGRVNLKCATFRLCRPEEYNSGAKRFQKSKPKTPRK